MLGIETINYSLRNLLARKSRSFLTILSILAGITTIFIFVSFGWGLYDYIHELQTESSANLILIQPKGSGAPGLDTTFKLTDKDVKTVDKTLGVKQATGVIMKVAEVTQGKKRIFTFLAGYDPQVPILMKSFNIGIYKGRELKKGDVGKVVLGYNYQVPDMIFPKAYNLGDSIEVQGQKLSIVGFYDEVGDPPDDSQIYVINDFVNTLYPGQENPYGIIVAEVDTTNLDAVISRVEKNLRKERNQKKGQEDFFISSFEDMINAYSSALNVVIGFIIMIAFISVVVSAVNTTNTMVTSVLERIQEIGVIKSIGARNSDIFQIFLFESSFLGFLSGVFGVLLGFGLTSLGGSILAQLGWGFLRPHYSVALFLGCIGFATITGAISGAVPAYNASKLKPVDALRYE